eukprot:340658-Prorocentrum_minimum.AAC.1
MGGRRGDFLGAEAQADPRDGRRHDPGGGDPHAVGRGAGGASHRGRLRPGGDGGPQGAQIDPPGGGAGGGARERHDGVLWGGGGGEPLRVVQPAVLRGQPQPRR